MAKMGIGYGSEYQLLRYMGRHRKLLNKKILESIGRYGPIDWDAVFTIDNEWFCIEAKAHKSEIIDPIKK